MTIAKSVVVFFLSSYTFNVSASDGFPPTLCAL